MASVLISDLYGKHLSQVDIAKGKFLPYEIKALLKIVCLSREGHTITIMFRSVARLSRTQGKITSLQKLNENISAHDSRIRLRLSKIVRHMLKSISG